MKRLAFLTLLAFGGPLRAQSIELPAAVTVPTPGLVLVAPTKVDGDAVAWFTLDPGLQLIPAELLRDSTKALGIAIQPGVYRLRAVAAKVVGGKAAISPVAECVVTVGQPGPTPPGPGPTPPDAFAKAVADAYAAETDPNKAALLKKLVTFYANAGGLLQARKIDPKDVPVWDGKHYTWDFEKEKWVPDVPKAPSGEAPKTVGELFTRYSASLHDPVNGIPHGALPKVMAVIGADLNVTLGGTAAGIDPTLAVDAGKARAAFAKYASALRGIQ
jgi:hypothetical protein